MPFKPFDKEYSPGMKFTSEYQPTPEAKRRGKMKAKALRESMMEILRCEEVDDESAAEVMKVMPGKRRDRVSVQDVMCLKQIMEARNGNVKAYEAVMKTLGELQEKMEITGKDGKALTPAFQIEIIDNREDVEKDSDN